MVGNPVWNNAPNFKQITGFSLKIFTRTHIDYLSQTPALWQEFVYFVLVYVLASPFVEMEARARQEYYVFCLLYMVKYYKHTDHFTSKADSIMAQAPPDTETAFSSE